MPQRRVRDEVHCLWPRLRLPLLQHLRADGLPALEANERGLAMGCLGSHPMGNMGMHMAGAAHGDCLVGHNHNDYMATGGAATSFSSVVVALVVALAAFALA